MIYDFIYLLLLLTGVVVLVENRLSRIIFFFKHPRVSFDFSCFTNPRR